jgi:hypothetical protein
LERQIWQKIEHKNYILRANILKKLPDSKDFNIKTIDLAHQNNFFEQLFCYVFRLKFTNEELFHTFWILNVTLKNTFDLLFQQFFVWLNRL